MSPKRQGHLVILIGAGAMAPLGYPLMSDLPIHQGIQEMPETSRSIPGIEFGRVWEFLSLMVADIKLFS